MSANRRNALVGITMLLALLLLGYMIFKFGGRIADPFAGDKIAVSFEADNVAGLSPGSAVTYRGVDVGRVETIRRTGLTTVGVTALLDADVPLPGNLKAVIRQTNFLGTGAVIALEMNGSDPVGELADGTSITTRYAGNDIIPSEISELAAAMNVAVSDFNDAGVIDNLNARISAIGQLVEDLRQVTGQEQTQTDIRTAIANLREATDQAKQVTANFQAFSTDMGDIRLRLDRILESADETVADTRKQINQAGDNIDRVSRQLDDRLRQAEATLDNIESITRKMDEGEGTVGRLLNDPALYDSSLELLRLLEDIGQDAERVVEQIEEEGIRLRL